MNGTCVRTLPETIVDHAFSRGMLNIPREPSILYSHIKSPMQLVFVGSCDTLEEWMLNNHNGLPPRLPSLPHLTMFHLCSLCNCSLTGSSCSVEIILELILLGSKIMWKFCGTCGRSSEVSWDVRSASNRIFPQERKSVSMLLLPGNHWLQPLLHLQSAMLDAHVPHPVALLPE